MRREAADDVRIVGGGDGPVNWLEGGENLGLLCFQVDDGRLGDLDRGLQVGQARGLALLDIDGGPGVGGRDCRIRRGRLGGEPKSTRFRRRAAGHRRPVGRVCAGCDGERVGAGVIEFCRGFSIEGEELAGADRREELLGFSRPEEHFRRGAVRGFLVEGVGAGGGDGTGGHQEDQAGLASKDGQQIVERQRARHANFSRQCLPSECGWSRLFGHRLATLATCCS